MDEGYLGSLACVYIYTYTYINIYIYIERERERKRERQREREREFLCGSDIIVFDMMMRDPRLKNRSTPLNATATCAKEDGELGTTRTQLEPQCVF